MKGGKRYWFKLYNNFFDNEKIKQIKRKKDGDRLIVIFINCLAITANCESGGYLKISENKFFTIETLAHHMGRNQKSIENALDIFQEYSMIVQDEYGYKIKNWNKYQNSQEKWIKDKKEFTKIGKNVDTEREKELKKEIETEDSKRYEFHKYYTNEIWGMSNGYELCLDEGILGIDGCVKMILDYLKIRNLI